MWIAVLGFVKIFPNLEATGLGVFNRVLKNLRKASALLGERRKTVEAKSKMLAFHSGKPTRQKCSRSTHSIASFQTSAHASGHPCSKELMTNELNDDTGGRPPSRCPAGIRDRPVTPCARSPGTTAAHGCRLIACVCRPARRPTSRTVQDGAQASIAALKRAAHARSQAGACYSLCRARQRVQQGRLFKCLPQAGSSLRAPPARRRMPAQLPRRPDMREAYATLG